MLFNIVLTIHNFTFINLDLALMFTLKFGTNVSLIAVKIITILKHFLTRISITKII